MDLGIPFFNYSLLFTSYNKEQGLHLPASPGKEWGLSTSCYWWFSDSVGFPLGCQTCRNYGILIAFRVFIEFSRKIEFLGITYRDYRDKNVIVPGHSWYQCGRKWWQEDNICYAADVDSAFKLACLLSFKCAAHTQNNRTMIRLVWQGSKICTVTLERKYVDFGRALKSHTVNWSPSVDT